MQVDLKVNGFPGSVENFSSVDVASVSGATFLIGTDFTGRARAPGSLGQVSIVTNSADTTLSGNLVGGTTPHAGNVITGGVSCSR